MFFLVQMRLPELWKKPLEMTLYRCQKHLCENAPNVILNYAEKLDVMFATIADLASADKREAQNEHEIQES